MTTTARPRFWCLNWERCGYNGESLGELVEHHTAHRMAAWEAFQAPRREANRRWKARKREKTWSMKP